MTLTPSSRIRTYLRIHSGQHFQPSPFPMIPRSSRDLEPQTQDSPASTPAPALASPPETYAVLDFYAVPLTSNPVNYVLNEKDGDTLTETPTEFLIHLAPKAKALGEDITLNRAHLVWWSKCPRLVTRKPELFKPDSQ